MRRQDSTKPWIILAGIFGLLATSCDRLTPTPPGKPFALPSPSEIKRIHVLVGQSPDGTAPPVREFEIVDHFETILDAFEPNRSEPRALKWESGPELRVDFKDDASIPLLISVYWPGGEEFAFRPNATHTYYRGGSTKRLMHALRELSPPATPTEPLKSPSRHRSPAPPRS